MTAAVIALAIVLAGAVAAVITLSLRYASQSHDLVMAGRMQLETAQLGETYRMRRDDLAAQLAVAQDALKDERTLRELAEAQRNTAYQEARDHVVKQVEASGIADAAALVNRLLWEPLPGAGQARADDRGSEATVMQPAGAAVAVGAGGGVP